MAPFCDWNSSRELRPRTQTVCNSNNNSNQRSKSSQQLAEEFGVSSSTIERVRTILDQGTPEQIQSLRNKNETSEGPGARTVYEQVQSQKLKSRVTVLPGTSKGQAHKQRLSHCYPRHGGDSVKCKECRTVNNSEGTILGRPTPGGVMIIGVMVGGASNPSTLSGAPYISASGGTLLENIFPPLAAMIYPS